MGKPKRFNDYRTEGDVTYLVLTGRDGSVKGEAKIDTADLPALKAAGDRWCMGSHGYAFRRAGGEGIYLARQLIAPEGELFVDHINRDRLDNRRANLRTVTHADNQRNRSPQKGSTTGIRGVAVYNDTSFPYWVRLGAIPHVFALKVRTLNIGRITASLARAQHWGAEAA